MLGKSLCDNKVSSAAKPGKTIIISNKKWTGILNHLNRHKDQEAITRSEQKYRDYLINESAAMTGKWENSRQKIREKENQERARQEKEKILEGERRYRELKFNDEKKRMDQVAKANDLMKRLKSGPRELDSAYIFSEVLAGQELQRTFNAKAKAELHEAYLQDGRENIQQAEQWMREHREQLLKERTIRDSYKRDVFQMSQNKIKLNAEMSKKQTDLEKEECNYVDREIQLQIEKEREILQKRKDSMRRNALEAMKMAEQRRLRDKMESEIESKIIDVISTGKQSIDELRKQKEKADFDNNNRIREKLAVRLFEESGHEEKAAKELEAMRKANAEYNEKLQLKEQRRLEHIKKMKMARIQSHNEEVEEKKRQQQEQYKQFQMELEKRYRNEQLYVQFEIDKRNREYEKSKQMRDEITQQITEKRKVKAEQLKKEQTETAKQISDKNGKDDSEFFAYAEDLMRETKNKKRPILPLIKTIQKYKVEHLLNDKDETLPHLKSNINIGMDNSLTSSASPAQCFTSQSPLMANQSSPILLASESPASVRSAGSSSSGGSKIKYNLNEMKQMKKGIKSSSMDFQLPPPCTELKRN